MEQVPLSHRETQVSEAVNCLIVLLAQEGLTLPQYREAKEKLDLLRRLSREDTEYENEVLKVYFELLKIPDLHEKKPSGMDEKLEFLPGTAKFHNGVQNITNLIALYGHLPGSARFIGLVAKFFIPEVKCLGEIILSLSSRKEFPYWEEKLYKATSLIAILIMNSNTGNLIELLIEGFVVSIKGRFFNPESLVLARML